MTDARFGWTSGGRHRQGGAMAVEFALVFAMFFVVMYGIVAYGIVFAVQHSLTQAANEGARAAVRDVGDTAARMALAQTVATGAVSWLGARAPVPVVNAANCVSTPYVCVTVSLTYNYAANPIVPSLPGLGVVLPANLRGQATVQL
ncbi:MAG: pilus assembly protein [Sulfuricella sp.]|nr:pilus assembly protein [Sulfuricella sp.]